MAGPPLPPPVAVFVGSLCASIPSFEPLSPKEGGGWRGRVWVSPHDSNVDTWTHHSARVR